MSTQSRRILSLIGVLAFAIAACGLPFDMVQQALGTPTQLAKATAPSIAATAPAQVPTVPPSQVPTQAPAVPTNPPGKVTNDCGIITQREAADLLGVAVEMRENNAASTNQVDFFSGPVSVIKSACSYDAGTSLVIFYVIKPDQTAPAELARLWAANKTANPNIQQNMTGIGDDAYAGNDLLVFKKGNYYVEITVIIPGLHKNNPAVDQKQLDLEKSFARIALTRLPQ